MTGTKPPSFSQLHAKVKEFAIIRGKMARSWGKFKFIFSAWFFLNFVTAHGASQSHEEGNNSVRGGGKKKAKFFSVFQLVTFKNGACSSEGGGGLMNGTCYTSEECEQKGGGSGGVCAEGFGVCCLFVLSCGSTTSEAVSYLTPPTDLVSDSRNNPCSYTVCKCSQDVARIRLDFRSFDIAGPFEGTTAKTLEAKEKKYNFAIGDCTTDTFTLNNPGGVGSPVICGHNTGQHMIVDASDGCNVASFHLGKEAANKRNWDIVVTQYTRGQADKGGGPPGCLQYFTEAKGTISSFNFPTRQLTSSATHLSNQHYSACIRRLPEMNCICYKATIEGKKEDPEKQGSFGLSNPAEAKPAQGAMCSHDYIRIPGVYKKDAKGNFVETGALCGRILSTGSSATAPEMVCSSSRPFVLTFRTDSDEKEKEQMVAPGGIVGFSLDYKQTEKCPPE